LEYLKDLKIEPTLFVVLALPFEQAIERKRQRDKRISNEEIESLRHRTERTKDFLQYIETSYNSHMLKINAATSAQNVLENVGFQLENI